MGTPGRPQKAAEELRSRSIHIRLTEEQFAAIQAAAEKDRRTVSDFIRLAALDAAEKK